VSVLVLEDGSVDMGSSFDLFDVASHPEGGGLLNTRPGDGVDRHAGKRRTQGAEAPEGTDAAPELDDGQFIAMRRYLCACMEAAGFKADECEWWHFTLRDEPFPDTYFDFEI
jgi:D-alanyl-D-alanine dipeptidase